MAAKTRWTAYGKAVERFIDGNSQYLSPVLAEKLEDLAAELDALAEDAEGAGEVLVPHREVLDVINQAQAIINQNYNSEGN